MLKVKIVWAQNEIQDMPTFALLLHFATCRNLVAMWHVLSGEAQLLRQVFMHLLEVLSLSLPYQEKPKSQGRTTRIETSVPKAVSIQL